MIYSTCWIKLIDRNGLRDNIPIVCAANMPDDMTDLSNIRYELCILRKQVEFLTRKCNPSVTYASKLGAKSDVCEQQRKIWTKTLRRLLLD